MIIENEQDRAMATPSSLEYSIRSSIPADAAGVNAIQTHYILHSRKTIYYEPFGVESTRDKISNALGSNYPFLVALTTSGVTAAIDILAYASLSPFRPQQGWAPTAELSLFVHPSHTRKGLGRKLLEELLHAMRNPDDHAAYFQSDAPRPPVKSIVAVLVIDEDDLEGYYTSFGFERVGVFKEGGVKDGIKLDITMMQLML